MTRFWESNRAPLTVFDRAAHIVATYGVAVYVLCIPLEFTGVWLRQQLSRYVLVVMAVAFAYLVIRRRLSIAVPRTLSLALLAIYVLASVGSWVLTRRPGAASSVLDVVLYPMVALLLANLVLDDRDCRRAWTAFLVSALGVALLGGVLSATETSIWMPNRLVAVRANITFGDPNITARFLNLGACAAILMHSARKAPPWLAFATATACGAVLPLTLSRSGLVLFGATAVFAVVIAFQHRRAAAIAAVALLVFAISTGVNPTTRQRALDTASTAVSIVTGRPASFGGGDESASHDQTAAEDNRTYLVAAGLRMFRDHPVTGVGFGGYQHALVTEYRRFLPSDRSGANLDTLSHAALVTTLAEQGVIGTVLLIAFLVALAREAWIARRGRPESSSWAVVAAALIVPIFVYSQIEGRFVSEPYLWLCVGLLYSALRRRREAVVLGQAAPAGEGQGRLEVA